MSSDLDVSPLLGPLLLVIFHQRVIAPDSDAGLADLAASTALTATPLRMNGARPWQMRWPQDTSTIPFVCLLAPCNATGIWS